MNRLFIIVLTGYLFIGCDPNKIQMKEPLIRVSNDQLSSRPFLANNVTKIVMEIELQEDLARSEVVTLTTTHGSLFPLNSFDFSSENSELILNPVENTTKFILRTGKTPGEAFISATVDKMIGFDTVNFLNAYSETISMISPKSNLSLSSGETIEVTIKLERQEGLVSSGQPITLSTNDAALANVPMNVSSNDAGEATITVTPLSVGILSITGTVNSDATGSLLSSSISLTINN